MKVNYLPKNKSRNLYAKQILILIAVFIVGAVVFSLFKGTIISLVSPIWKARNIVIHRGHLVPTVEEEARENMLLELVGQKPEPNMVLAAVLTYPPQTPYDIIVIDAGSNDTITIGSEVTLPEGALVGIVSEVFPKRAKVKLLSSDSEETNAILERNNEPVKLIGFGGGNFKFSVPRDSVIEVGDRIISADITSRLLAVVGGISAEPTDSFKEVLAKSPTNIFSLRFVFVRP